MSPTVQPIFHPDSSPLIRTATSALRNPLMIIERCQLSRYSWMHLIRLHGLPSVEIFQELAESSISSAPFSGTTFQWRKAKEVLSTCQLVLPHSAGLYCLYYFTAKVVTEAFAAYHAPCYFQPAVSCGFPDSSPACPGAFSIFLLSSLFASVSLLRPFSTGTQAWVPYLASYSPDKSTFPSPFFIFLLSVSGRTILVLAKERIFKGTTTQSPLPFGAASHRTSSLNKPICCLEASDLLPAFHTPSGFWTLLRWRLEPRLPGINTPTGISVFVSSSTGRVDPSCAICVKKLSQTPSWIGVSRGQGG